MRKFLRFPDKTEVEIAPLTYLEFMTLNLWAGDSGFAYEAWMRHNNFVDAEDYDDNALAGAQLVICSDAPIPPDKIQFDLDGHGLFVTVYKQEQPLEFGKHGCHTLKKERWTE